VRSHPRKKGVFLEATSGRAARGAPTGQAHNPEEKEGEGGLIKKGKRDARVVFSLFLWGGKRGGKKKVRRGKRSDPGMLEKVFVPRGKIRFTWVKKRLLTGIRGGVLCNHEKGGRERPLS